MKLIAVMPVRNEAWILGLSARVALMWCDELLLLDHASTDATGDIIAALQSEFPGRVEDEYAAGPWKEMEHRQDLLTFARRRGATHVAIVDADEVLCGDSLPHVRRWAETLMPGECINVRMRSMWRGVDRYRVDPCVWSDRRDLALVFRDSPNLSWAPRHDGYQHHARAPRGSVPVMSSIGDPRKGQRMGSNRLPGTPDLGVMHLQFADWRRLVAKHDRYKMHERLTNPHASIDWINRTYNQALDEALLRTEPAPAEWWAPYAHLMKYLDLNAVPWFEDEVRRLMTAHGRDKFAGLDLRTV